MFSSKKKIKKTIRNVRGVFLRLVISEIKGTAKMVLSTTTNRAPRKTFPIQQLLLVCVISLATFYAGILVGMHVGTDCDIPSIEFKSSPKSQREECQRLLLAGDPVLEDVVKKRVDNALETVSQHQQGKDSKVTRFEGMSKFAYGAVRTSKEEFRALYDDGYPSSHGKEKGTEDVLILYNRQQGLPENAPSNAIYEDGTGIPKFSAAEATANCDALHIVSTKSMFGPTVPQCLAIVGEYPSFHVKAWMRANPKDLKPVSHHLPLAPVSRGKQSNGLDQFVSPSAMHINLNYKLLKTYFDTVDDLKRKLKPILRKVATNNSVVVLVCNFGQADLLANFICASKAKGLDVSNVLVFATDQATYDVATTLGVSSYYDEALFEAVPENEAKTYGDKTFRDMMYAKVLAVQLVNMLGYDVLFQDVDIVWWRNPLELFHDQDSNLYDFDILFQDDGARSVRYAPYSANSGFYYVRHNPRTVYLFTSLLYSGDLIMSTKSHQQALTALITEHSSLYNLRIKTMSGDDFPGGFQYHRNRALMRNIVDGKIEPYLFHMSWTENKDNKLKFFKQMGMWFLNPICEGTGLQEEQKKAGMIELYQSSCCAAEPLVTCFYKDKPSIAPCNDSPQIDKKGKPFWK